MKKLLGVALLGAVAASPVGAQSVMCGGTLNEVCVLAKFEVSGTGDVLNMWVYNGATAFSKDYQSTITTLMVGIPGNGITGTLTGASFYNSGTITPLTIPGDWNGAPNNGWGGQFLAIDLGAAAGGSSGISTCSGPFAGGQNPTWSTCDRPGVTAFDVGTWDFLKFTWNLSGGTLQSVDNIAWGWKAQSVKAPGSTANGYSIECGSSVTILNAQDKLCGTDTYDPPQNIVPEPATMTLLATGLAGMAAARRRRKNVA